MIAAQDVGDLELSLTELAGGDRLLGAHPGWTRVRTKSRSWNIIRYRSLIRCGSRSYLPCRIWGQCPAIPSLRGSTSTISSPWGLKVGKPLFSTQPRDPRSLVLSTWIWRGVQGGKRGVGWLKTREDEEMERRLMSISPVCRQSQASYIVSDMRCSGVWNMTNSITIQNRLKNV